MAAEPLSAKKQRVRPGGASRTRASATSMAGSWVKPAKITCSRRSICSRTAAPIVGFAWPNRLTHQELMASRYRRPSWPSSHTPDPLRSGIRGIGPSWSFIWVQGCQT